MANIKYTQSAFNQGILDPYVDARSDLSLYIKGCKILENYLILPQGGITRRRGFEAIYDLPDERCVIVEYEFNADDQQYLLVLCHQTMMVFKNKLYQATITTPWPIDKVKDLQWAQSADELVVVHPDYYPQVIERGATHTNWTCANVTFTNMPTDWNATDGYPRCVTFHQQRLYMAGTKAKPQTIWGSRTADFYNFDMSATSDSYAFNFTISTNRVIAIKFLQPSFNLFLFTSGGEFEMSGNGDAISPANVQINPRTNYGIGGNNKVLNINGELLFTTRFNRDFRSFNYQFEQDKFIGEDYSLLPHDLINNPIDMCHLSNYLNTHSDYAFVVNEDGTMPCLNLNTNKEVLGWSKITTNGEFKNCGVIATDHGDGKAIPTLYTVVKRLNGVYLEALTEEPIPIDCWHTGTVGTAKKNWDGLTRLASQEAQVLIDGHAKTGYVHAPTTISPTGDLDLTQDTDTIYAGLYYTTQADSVVISISINNQSMRGEQHTYVQAWVNLYDTQSININDTPIVFKQFGTTTLDGGVDSFTGTEQVTLAGTTTDPQVSFKVTEPLLCTILGFTVELEVNP